MTLQGRTIARGLTGAAAGLIGASAMSAFASLIAHLREGREAAGAASGSHRAHRGVQPPQAHGAAEDDATVIVGRAAARRITGREPSRQTMLRLGAAAHLGFGAGLGVAYALLSAPLPALRAGHGLAYGAAVWVVADEGAMPALGLSRPPQALSPGLHVYALAGHLVYGAILESVLRVRSILPLTAPRQVAYHLRASEAPPRTSERVGRVPRHDACAPRTRLDDAETPPC